MAVGAPWNDETILLLIRANVYRLTGIELKKLHKFNDVCKVQELAMSDIVALRCNCRLLQAASNCNTLAISE